MPSPKPISFEPRYEPESRPHACCEMMVGMNSGYNYRFQLDFKSVDAMANIKPGSGCNLLGYYMYRGGTTPTGETIPYLNEGQMPQLSYDLQAAVGEYGQIRRSWHRLRLLHYFCQSFGEQLCRTKTVLPREAADMEPADTEHLRYSVWVSGDSGFVFLNNFQDHFDLPDRKNESILLQLPEGDLQMEGIDLASGENAILPFNLDMDGAMLRYATAQPITKIEKTWFFSAPVGMVPAYYFDAAAVRLDCDTKDGLPCCLPEAGKTSHFTVHGKQGPLTVVTLNREDSLRFYKLDCDRGEAACLSSAPLLWDGKTLKAETVEDTVTVCAYPAGALDGLLRDDGVTSVQPTSVDLFHGVRLNLRDRLTARVPLTPAQTGPCRYTLDLPEKALRSSKTMLLRVQYSGDIGHAFIDGQMIAGNFANGAVWDIRVDDHAGELDAA